MVAQIIQMDDIELLVNCQLKTDCHGNAFI